MKVLYKKVPILNLLFALLLMDVWAQDVMAQTSNAISGKVTGPTGEAIPGVTVLEKGTSNGTTTGIDGGYTILVSGPNKTLVFSFVGYTTQELPLNGTSTLNISLNEDTRALKEIVVVGYGEREKKDVVGSIATVNAKELEKSVALNPQSAMQGRMPGVFVSTPGGNPNARPTVRIRGVSTLNDADPLYVIDGIPIVENSDVNMRGTQNPMNLVNPNDIESISVLKDAAAAAVYGVRAANGVILITTKKGKAGKPRIEINAQRGVQNITKTYDVLNTQELTTIINESFDNRPSEEALRPNEVKVGNPVYRGNDPTYDWQTPLINKNAVIEDYSARILGGNDATTYYVSGGYARNESVLIHNSNERFSMAANVNTQANKYISAGVTYRSSYLRGKDNTQGDLASMVNTTPWQPIYDPNGPGGYAPVVDITYKPNPNYDPSKLNQSFHEPFIIDQARALYGVETNNNNFATMGYTDRTYHVLRNTGSTYLQVEPLKGFKIRGNLQVDWTYTKGIAWDSYAQNIFQQNPFNKFRGENGLSKGSYGEREVRDLGINKEVVVNYTKTFGQHNFDATFVASDYQFHYRNLDISDANNPNDDPDKRNVDNLPPFINGFTGRDRASTLGYMGRISYNYASKYYLDLVTRRDGSFKFAPGYKWGTFPAISAAWRISAENFMASMSFINDLKVRAGWGRLGSDRVRSYAYLSTLDSRSDYGFGSGNGNYQGNVNGVFLPNFPVIDLSWETAETTNIALDGELLNNKISFTAEYYIKTTRDILQTADLPISVGNQVQPALNIATVRNSGIEFSANYNGQIGDFNYNFGGNITTVKNRVLKTFRNQPFGSNYGRIEVGKPMNYLWGPEVGGIFQTEEEVKNYQEDYDDGRGNNQAPGDMWFKDLYGNPTEPGQFRSSVPDSLINDKDNTYLGKTIAGYYYGFNLGANYRNFDLSLFFQGIGDVQRYNQERATYETIGTRGVNQLASVLNRWTPENPSSDMPRAVYGDPAGNNRFSSRFVEDAGFLRLKNVQLGYTLPANIKERLGFIDNFRIFFTGINVFTATKWTGLDPETGIYVVEDRRLDQIPNSRSFLLGVTASF